MLALVLALATLATHTPTSEARPGAMRSTASYLSAGHAERVGSAVSWHPSVPQPLPASDADPSALSARCADSAGAWLGMRWRESVRWRVNETTYPGYLGNRSAVTRAIRNGAVTVATGRNDCGFPETLALRQRFGGSTDRVAGVTGSGGCGQRDGHSVVSFGRLSAGTLAVTCVWWLATRLGGRSVEADILVDAADGAFALTTTAGCTARWDLESTLTHEFGHVYGLGHVAYAEHGDLTMSDGLPECSTAYRGLGLGDYRLLRERYGARKADTG